jgi:hypothetical protein
MTIGLIFPGPNDWRFDQIEPPQRATLLEKEIEPGALVGQLAASIGARIKNGARYMVVTATARAEIRASSSKSRSRLNCTTNSTMVVAAIVRTIGSRRTSDHRCMLIARQRDQLASTGGPVGLGILAMIDRKRIDRHGLRQSILVDNLLQILGQGIVPVRPGPNKSPSLASSSI